MNILNIFTSHTTPLQTFGLSLYIGGIMAMIFIERELYISLSKIYGAMTAFMAGITILSLDMNKADINMKTAIILTVIGVTAMITPLVIAVIIEKIKDRKKGSE